MYCVPPLKPKIGLLLVHVWQKGLRGHLPHTFMLHYPLTKAYLESRLS